MENQRVSLSHSQTKRPKKLGVQEIKQVEEMTVKDQLETNVNGTLWCLSYFISVGWDLKPAGDDWIWIWAQLRPTFLMFNEKQ